MIYRVRKSQTGYGRPIGVLMLEERIPCPPGTVGNPTTFPFPVCYEIVRGVGIASLKQLNQPDSLQPFIAAARSLVDKGVVGITGNCGLMIVHQAALARAVDVPVFMSSLLQLPFIAGLLGPPARIGIIASSSTGLKPEHVAMATGGADIALALTTMDGCPNFRASVGDESGVLDFAKVEAEVIGTAQELVARHPDIGALLFECTDLAPYAAAVQDAIGLPVFDITSLIDTVAAALRRKPFVGVY